MATSECEQFRCALKDIANHVHFILSPYDRVRCVEWCRKLINIPEDTIEQCKLKNEYVQLLRIQVRNRFLHGPFAKPPCENENVKPLAEALGQLLAQNIPILPPSGPIQPALHHKSPDGRAYVSVKQLPGGGVFCYMAVTPDCS
ncbi:uncharacterized protein LOC109604353 [Aethina tumida]|uniref:uncharacterized protein LOC109604353 n=1 Tax=Aethina tumida TaxID=116153 RepID=UPI0021486B76|nr:uncharacterized protein LOC109604353 [Aethina tumida]